MKKPLFNAIIDSSCRTACSPAYHANYKTMKCPLIVCALLGGVALLHFPLTTVAQPVATTLAATSVTSTNSTVNGTVNPNGTFAAAYFQYGLTTNYGYLGGF